MRTNAPHDATVQEDDDDVLHLRLSIETPSPALAEDEHPLTLADADQTFVRPFEDLSYY